MITRLRLIIASFILGALVGAAALNLVSGRHLDNAELEIRKLRSSLADQNEKTNLLEKKLAVRQKLIVNEIIVSANLNDEFEKLEVEAAAKKLLKVLKGKDLKELDPNLVINIIDKRIVETPEHKYRITVKGTLISERIIMYIDAEEIREVPMAGESGGAFTPVFRTGIGGL